MRLEGAVSSPPRRPSGDRERPPHDRGVSRHREQRVFPTGQVELRTSEVVPKVGDTLKHGTDEWQVIEVGTD